MDDKDKIEKITKEVKNNLVFSIEIREDGRLEMLANPDFYFKAPIHKLMEVAGYMNSYLSGINERTFYKTFGDDWFGEGKGNATKEKDEKN